MGPGEKAQFVDALDNVISDELVPTYSIDVIFAISPIKGIRCGAVVVYKMNLVDPKDWGKYDLSKIDPKEVKEMTESTAKHTEVMHQDPLRFKETDGQWIPWGMSKALEISDKLGGQARISVKCPELRITQTRSPKNVAMGRGDIHTLFPVLKDIDELLIRRFHYDPWSGQIRRGVISAAMAKR